MRENTKKVVRRKKVKLPTHHTLGVYEYYLGQVISALLSRASAHYDKDHLFNEADDLAKFLMSKSGKDA